MLIQHIFHTKHWCFIHVCFIQVTMCCAPDSLTRLCACTFLLIPHLLGSHNQYKYKSARTEARKHIKSTKQCSKFVTWTKQPWIIHQCTSRQEHNKNVKVLLLTSVNQIKIVNMNTLKLWCLNTFRSNYMLIYRAGHIALWNHSKPLHSWTNLYFESDGAQ